jgi:hypothetical protein
VNTVSARADSTPAVNAPQPTIAAANGFRLSRKAASAPTPMISIGKKNLSTIKTPYFDKKCKLYNIMQKQRFFNIIRLELMPCQWHIKKITRFMAEKIKYSALTFR